MHEAGRSDRVAELKRLHAVTEKLIADIKASPKPDPEKLEAACAMLERIKGALDDAAGNSLK